MVPAKSAWSVKIRHVPPRHCRDAWSGHTTTAMYDMSTPRTTRYSFAISNQQGATAHLYTAMYLVVYNTWRHVFLLGVGTVCGPNRRLWLFAFVCRLYQSSIGVGGRGGRRLVRLRRLSTDYNKPSGTAMITPTFCRCTPCTATRCLRVCSDVSVTSIPV